uniref:uncharacterized protein LOC122587348 n=1 Tax=Erigeron canadensis TaxID=72917 RepID=UPI001CB9C216|nr:uncharacterized protein LOC122587348 [Erigeron canadensis]
MASKSSTFRFLTLPEKPPLPNNHNNFEFHENDVVFPFDDVTYDFPSPSPANLSSSPPVHRQLTSGLYAALSNDQNPLVRKKPNMSPSQSAATAARTISPVTARRSSEHYHQSAPVNVPVWPKNRSSSKYLKEFDDVDDGVAEGEDDDDVAVEGMVPPHEIVARSYVTFSVFEGAGRTLKGRDLCRVRNAVFQQTGFLD